MGVIRRWRKSNMVLRLARALGPGDPDVAVLDSSRDDALRELLDLCESDVDCAAVIRSLNLDRPTLEDLYWRLLAAGAGQWIGAHYVPVSVIAYARLLEPAAEGILSAESRNEVQRVAIALIDAVEKGGFA